MMERPWKGGTGAIQAYLHDGGLIYSPPPLPTPPKPQHRSDCARRKNQSGLYGLFNAPPRGIQRGNCEQCLYLNKWCGKM
jgi:hypothetical protein